MNKGKRKCERLKIIRKYIAKANGIEYEPTKCEFEGECPGTCPKCDAELAELERQMDEKEKRGEKVTRVIDEDYIFDYNRLFRIPDDDPSKYLEESKKFDEEREIFYGKDEEEEEQNEHGGDDGPELEGDPIYIPKKYCLTGDYNERAGKEQKGKDSDFSCTGCIITLVVAILIIAALVWYFFIR